MRQLRMNKRLVTLSDKVKVFGYGEELTKEQKADYLLNGVLLIYCPPFLGSEKNAEESRLTRIRNHGLIKEGA